MESQKAALAALLAQPREVVRTAASTLAKLAANVLRKPDEPTFRSLRLSNEALNRTLLCAPGGRQLLLAVGFSDAADPERLVLSADAPLEPLSQLLATLEIIVAHLDGVPRTTSAAGPSTAPRLVRVCGASGWVLHGLVLEFADGSRTGAMLANDGSPLALDDAAVSARGGKWQPVRDGERIVGISGNHSTMGYLCGSITLELTSGRRIDFLGENTSVFGERFRHAVPAGEAAADVRFQDGRCLGLVLASERASQPRPVAMPSAAQPSPRALSTADQLLMWAPSGTPSARAPTAPRAPLAQRPRVLHCHDMKGGYCAAADEDYLAVFSGWGAIDVFCYFAHERVSLPPAVWVDACHARGIPCLGTLIVEGDTAEAMRLLASPTRTAARLAALAAHHAVDGFLINMEAAVPAAGVPRLVELLRELRAALRARVGPQSLVIYYDAVDVTGRVRYQNALTPANFDFFEACDGLFTNYWWDASRLASSAELAGPQRAHDVYAGVDCFARGPVGYTAGPGCRSHCLAAREAGVSLALFAPGWSLECGEASCKPLQQAAESDRKFWLDLGIEQAYRSDL